MDSPDCRASAEPAVPKLRWGIGRRLLLQILLFSSLITFVLTIVQLYLDYERDVSEIESRFTVIQDSYLDSLTASLWNMDRKLLASQLEGIASLPDMTAAAVIETVSGVQAPLEMSVGRGGGTSHKVREFPMIYHDRDGSRSIGVLRVKATYDGVYQRILDRTIVILVSQGVKTFIVSFFILFIIHRLITRHLVRISRFLGEMESHDGFQPLALDRRSHGEQDEFDLLVHAYNRMQEKLRQALKQLKENNEALEQRVEARTKTLLEQIAEREKIQQSLQKSEERFRDIAETASDWFWEMDDQLAFSFVSNRFTEITGIPLASILGKTRKDLLAAGVMEIEEGDEKRLWHCLENLQPFHNLEGRLHGEDDTLHYIQIGGMPFFNDEGRLLGYRGAGRDITVRKLAEEAIRRSRDELEGRVELHTAELRMLSQAVEQSPVSIIITDPMGRIEYVNPTFYEKTGYSPLEVIGRNPSLLKSELTPESVYRELWSSLSAGGDWSGEFLNRNKDGSDIWVQAHITPVKDPLGEITHYLAIEEDVTLRKSQERYILHQEQYDALTDLPNRMLATDRLNQMIKIAQREDNKVAVVFVDLDDFKKVNDTLGHDVGDRLLVEAARRLENSVRDGDTVARLSGDDFLILMSGLKDTSAAEIIAQKIIASFGSSFSVEGNDLVVTSSIGLSFYPDDGQDAAILMRNADAALFRAKESGRNDYHFFTKSMNDEAHRRLALEQQLRKALERDELFIAYQPIVESHSRRVVGAEALLRWHSREMGPIGPDLFIPIAEQTGLIADIGQWVIATASRQMGLWNARFGQMWTLAVNVSPRQFRVKNFIHSVQQGLSAGLDPSLLEIEVTEGLFVSNRQETQTLLSDLKSIGVRLSMDDFGTGYSSLSYLKTLPFDRMKVDKSFVRDIAEDPEDLALVTAAITMARSLGLDVVGEGVETEEQLAMLAALNCDFVQGYLFSRPLDAEAFELYLSEQLSLS